MTDRYETRNFASRVTAPVLIVHGEAMKSSQWK